MGQGLRESVWDREGVIRSILEPVPIPRMARVRQRFEDRRISDLAGTVDLEFERPGIGSAIRPGASVAVAVGSRGVANLAEIVRAVVANVKRRGGAPFLFPAMGSHGGATAEGQRAVLESLGVTEASVGAPIRATMETRVVGRTPGGQEVHLDRHAAEADGIVALGRVKPHTSFRGPFESGLMKMLAIGMGKQKGAESVHAGGFGRMAGAIPAFGRVVLARAPVLFGVAVVENAFEATCRIEAVPAAQIEAREPALLEEARRLMPAILIPRFDVLVVDRIGKDISGDGADPNITGTYSTPYATGGPEFQRYAVLGLTEGSHGNALGLGMADLTTRRVWDHTDFDEGYPNALTCREPHVVKMPMVMANDRLALQAAIFTCIDIDKEAVRMVRLADTAHVDVIGVSEALLDEIREDARFELLEPPSELVFDAMGNLF